MPFKKGEINSKGRPSGAKNKADAQIKASFELLVSDNLEQLKKDIASLEPLERVDMLLKIARFILPTASKIELKTDGEFMRPVMIEIIKKK